MQFRSNFRSVDLFTSWTDTPCSATIRPAGSSTGWALWLMKMRLRVVTWAV